MKWRDALKQVAADHTNHVLVTVLAVSGSAPRDAGAKMLITADSAYDTIGGGQLEMLATQTARQMLSDQQSGQHIQHFPLAAAAQQCCGGSVTVLFESFVSVLDVAIFGAGFVAQEVAGMLAKLDATCRLIDTRKQIRGVASAAYQWSDNPLVDLENLPPSTHVLIMTHDHDLDYQLVRACTEQQRLSVGLIGSHTKWQRFCARLLRDGVTETALSRVRCPVGIGESRRKEPYAVAVSIVAQLLQLEPQMETARLSWRQVKSALIQETDEGPV